MRFAAFYREHYSLILTTCFRRLSDYATAEDAAAEVFRVAWQQFTRRENPNIAWLYAITRNVIGNEYRRSARARSLLELLESSHQAPPDGSDDELRDAMMTLRPRDREILFLAYWEEMSAAEVAHVLAISPAAVWVRLSRARSSLRRALDRVIPESRQDSRSSGGAHG